MSESKAPSITRTALIFSLAFPAILLGTILVTWVAGYLLPYFDVEIDQSAIAFLAPALIAIGVSYGLGVAYGYRPEDKRGIMNIWLFAILITIAIGYSALELTPELFPNQWTPLDILLASGIWIIFTILLACIGLSKRNKIIKEAARTGASGS